MFRSLIVVGLGLSFALAVSGCSTMPNTQQSFREGHELRQQMEFVRTIERHNQVLPNIRLDRLLY